MDPAWVDPAVRGLIATVVFGVAFMAARVRWNRGERGEQGQTGDSGLD